MYSGKQKQRYQCNDCGKWMTDGQNLISKKISGNLPKITSGVETLRWGGRKEALLSLFIT
jgi:hypothetical protein